MAAPVRLQTHVWNPLGDRRALLLHDLTEDGTCWWRVASELADAGFMVLAPDLRGHGRSPAAAGHHLATLAGDVALLGAQWELLVGHGLGGAVAAHLLAGAVEVEAAVLLDPVLSLSDVQRASVAAQLRWPAGGVDPAALRAAHPGWHETDVQRRALAAGLCTPDVVDAVLADNDPWDVTGLLARWTARVQVIAADPDEGGLCDPAVVAAAGDVRIGVELASGVGGGVHRQAPDLVRAAVARVTA